jgi:hypothetical protein
MKDREMNAPETSEALRAYRSRLAMEWDAYLEEERRMLPPKERRAARATYLEAIKTETEDYRNERH